MRRARASRPHRPHAHSTDVDMIRGGQAVGNRRDDVRGVQQDAAARAGCKRRAVGVGAAAGATVSRRSAGTSGRRVGRSSGSLVSCGSGPKKVRVERGRLYCRHLEGDAARTRLLPAHAGEQRSGKGRGSRRGGWQTARSMRMQAAGGAHEQPGGGLQAHRLLRPARCTLPPTWHAHHPTCSPFALQPPTPYPFTPLTAAPDSTLPWPAW